MTEKPKPGPDKPGLSDQGPLEKAPLGQPGIPRRKCSVATDKSSVCLAFQVARGPVANELFCAVDVSRSPLSRTLSRFPG